MAVALFACKTCGYTTDRSNNLKRHELGHTSKPRRSVHSRHILLQRDAGPTCSSTMLPETFVQSVAQSLRSAPSC